MSINNHQNVLNLLLELGFSEHDGLVYLSVLKHGLPSTGNIVKDTSLHREQVYRSLSRLSEMGVILRSGDPTKNIYKAVDPRVLIEMIENKKNLAISAEKILRNMYAGQSQVIQVREGKAALQYLTEDIVKTLKKDDEYLILGGAWKEFNRLAQEYLPNFHRQLQKHNLGGRILSYQGHDAQEEKEMGWHIQIRILNEPDQNIASTVIYGDKVVIEILDPENIAVMIIQNKKVAEHYRQMFETLWVMARDN